MRRRAQQPGRTGAEQGPGRQAGQGDQEEQQRVDGVAPGIGVGAAEHADHRQRHHPYLRVDHLQPGGTQGAESTAGGVGFDRFGRAAGDLPGQVEQPADPEPGHRLLQWRMAQQPFSGAKAHQQHDQRRGRAGAKDDGKRRQQAEARAVAQHQDVGRARGDGGDEGKQHERQPLAHRGGLVSWERSGRGLGDMAIGSVGLRMAE